MFELGDVVRPSERYLKWQKKKHPKVNAATTGTVVGYKSPAKQRDGSYIGQVSVKWAFEGPGLLYHTETVRWDQIER